MSANFGKIHNTPLQRVSGNVNDAAFVSGLRVLCGNYSSDTTTPVAVLDDAGIQLLLGPTDCVLDVGLYSSDAVTTIVHAAQTPTGNDFDLNIFTPGDVNSTVLRNPAAVSGPNHFVTVNAMGSPPCSGRVKLTVLTL